MNVGVPQGSFLGHLLLSRSLGSVTHSHDFSYHSYADDTQLIHPGARANLCVTSLDIDTPTHLQLDKTLFINIDYSVVPDYVDCKEPVGGTLDDQLSFSA